MSWSWIYPVLATVGLAVITVVSRSFFMIPERELPLPDWLKRCLLYTSPSPRDRQKSRMPSSA